MNIFARRSTQLEYPLMSAQSYGGFRFSDLLGDWRSPGIEPHPDAIGAAERHFESGDGVRSVRQQTDIAGEPS